MYILTAYLLKYLRIFVILMAIFTIQYFYKQCCIYLDDGANTHNSLFVRLFLGQVNVKVYREDEKLKLKQEYQKFRSRTDLIWVFMSLIQLVIWPDVRALEIIFQIWLLYYYVSISLRENILRVNGSNIRPWWIIHHYLSTVVSLVTLTWPDGPAFRTFIKQNLYMTLAQGVVQILQTRYQQGRLYKLVAMGKATRMDVTGT